MQQHIGINHEHAVHLAHRPHVDVDLLEDAQSAQRTVGAADRLGVIERSRLDVVALVQDIGPQVGVIVLNDLHPPAHGEGISPHDAFMHLHRVIVRHIHHVTHIERFMLGVIGHVLVAIGFSRVERQVHGARSRGSVGSEGDILLIESIIAVVAQILGNTLAPLVQAVVIQQITTVDREV